MVGRDDASHRGFDGVPLKVVEESRLSLACSIADHGFSRLQLALRVPPQCGRFGCKMRTSGSMRSLFVPQFAALPVDVVGPIAQRQRRVEGFFQQPGLAQP
jgi:hypothetical protein